MADLTITAASVIPSTGARVVTGTAGETITAGMAVYFKSSDKRYYKAQNDGTSAEATAVGVATSGASAGQSLFVQKEGLLTIGATTAVGVTYCVSANAGGICPDADVGSAKYKRLVAVGYSTTQIELVQSAPAAALIA